MHIHAHQHLAPLAVDDLPLLVHHVVVAEHILAGVEVGHLHPLLGALDLLGDEAVFDGYLVAGVQPGHDALHPIRPEPAHEFVLQRHIEPGAARVSLSARPAPQLVVDAAALVALGADDVKAAQGHHLLVLLVRLRLEGVVVFLILFPGVQDIFVLGLGVTRGLLDEIVLQPVPHEGLAGQKVRVAAQQDVRAAAGHVGGDGDGVELAGLGHDLGLLGVELGVQHLMGDARPGELVRKVFALLHADGAHQQGPAGLVDLRDLVDHGPELPGLGGVDHVRHILADAGLVGGDLHHVQPVDGGELVLLGLGRAGHARQLVEHAEIVLEGDGGQRLVLPLHLHAFLGLQCLVQTLVVPAADHESARELVHDEHLAVLDHIVLVPGEQGVGPQGLLDVVVQLRVLRVGQVFHVEILLGLLDALGRQLDRAAANVAHIVAAVLLLDAHELVGLADVLDVLAPGELADEPVRLPIHLGAFLPLTADDEGGPGLVDEDGVHLVHDGVVELPLDHVLPVDHHVVPQVIEAELVVGAVGDVAVVGLPPLIGVQIVDDAAHGEPQKAVDLAHPLGVATGQIVVDRDDVDALAGERVQIGGEGGHQRLALAGLHLGDPALMEDHAAQQLHVEVAHAHSPDGGLPDHGEGFGQDVVQGLALCEPVLKELGLSPQLLVGHGLVSGLQGVDLRHDGPHLLQLALAGVPQQLIQKSHVSHLHTLSIWKCTTKCRPRKGRKREADKRFTWATRSFLQPPDDLPHLLPLALRQEGEEGRVDLLHAGGAHFARLLLLPGHAFELLHERVLTAALSGGQKPFHLLLCHGLTPFASGYAAFTQTMFGNKGGKRRIE